MDSAPPPPLQIPSSASSAAAAVSPSSCLGLPRGSISSQSQRRSSPPAAYSQPLFILRRLWVVVIEFPAAVPLAGCRRWLRPPGHEVGARLGRPVCGAVLDPPHERRVPRPPRRAGSRGQAPRVLLPPTPVCRRASSSFVITKPGRPRRLRRSPVALRHRRRAGPPLGTTRRRRPAAIIGRGRRKARPACCQLCRAGTSLGAARRQRPASSSRRGCRRKPLPACCRAGVPRRGSKHGVRRGCPRPA
jgi:hypothetical protein